MGGRFDPNPNVFASFNFTIRNIVQWYFLMLNNCKIHILAKKTIFLLYVPIAGKIRDFRSLDP